ncbi:MAG: nuclear transport factor 2 family protein [Actinomycetota bacterium]
MHEPDPPSSNGATVDAYFAAMRRGARAEEQMMALFADDAVYREPFTGEPDPAVGKEAIRARLRQGWESPLPDMELDVLDVNVDGDTARSRWECRSPAFPGPVRGTDHYEFRDGLITRLDVTLDDPMAS